MYVLTLRVDVQTRGSHIADQDLNKEAAIASTTPRPSLYTPNMLYNLQRLGQRNSSVSESLPMFQNLVSPAGTPPPMLPAYIKPLPARFAPDDIAYLQNKGALSIPDTELRDQLLRCYAEFVHPYMPLLDMHRFVATIDRNDGQDGISLLLFQAVMFASIATVDMRYLKAAGYESRRTARREFFNKTRLLYDFDCEVDRISLIQSLLLMTYWYETPDDQKDSHHWMGIAVSLAQTIGLHRNPGKSMTMEPARQQLWKRIWWSTYMRDRLIALGMRRPTRIKNGDFDVPMLTVDDFEIAALADGPSCMPDECRFMRVEEQQRRMAIMCIEKAKLCICISNVLGVQYSVLQSNHSVLSSEGSTRTTMVLVPRRLEPGVDQVRTCDEELQEWKNNLPEEAQYVSPSWSEVDAGNECMALNRSLLHMVYYATLSALHRPQVLPSSGMPTRDTKADTVDMSRRAVRLAATEITSIASTLYNLDLVRFFPTTGITVLLPAIIIHLLDIKAQDESTRRQSLQGFCQCMQIMAKLRDIYAAADYSTAFLEAAIRKAEITLPTRTNEIIKDPRNVITSSAGLMDAGRRMHLTNPPPLRKRAATGATHSGHLTPPPEDSSSSSSSSSKQRSAPTAPMTDDDIARRLSVYLSHNSPPNSDHHSEHSLDPASLALDNQHATQAIDPLLSNAGADAKTNPFSDGAIMIGADPNDVQIPPPQMDSMPFEPDFDSMVNLDAAGEVFSLDDGAWGAMQGESGGIALDMDWMKGMSDGFMMGEEEGREDNGQSASGEVGKKDEGSGMLGYLMV